MREVTGKEIALEISGNKIHLFSGMDLFKNDFLNLLGFVDENALKQNDGNVSAFGQATTPERRHEIAPIVSSDDENDSRFFNIEEFWDEEDIPAAVVTSVTTTEAALAEEYSYHASNHYSARYMGLNCFVLRHALKGATLVASKEDKAKLATGANSISNPIARLSEDSERIIITAPGVQQYRNTLIKLGATPRQNTGYSLPVSKVFEFEKMFGSMKTKLPKMELTPEVKALTREPIIGFDGTVDSLKDLPLDSLNFIKANWQSYKSKNASKKTIAEKLEDFGIKNLYDLLFWLPKRYIDKSNPAERLSDLLEGENAVLIGEVTGTTTAGSGRSEAGVFFVKTPEDEKSIRATFFSQKWLLTKYKKGDRVVINGKYARWNGSPQITGVTIEHAEEADLLPVVPVYSQSPSKGITTQMFLTAIRELISRMGKVKLPVYFRQEGRMDYFEALTELHFPTSLTNHTLALDDLAYYELVYMQIIIQEAKESEQSQPGIVMTGGEDKLQAKAIKSLPFELTKSQKFAIVEMNKKFATGKPTSTLLNADVGAGKSVIAIAACLKAVESGYQAVLLAPTDILARQLFASLEKTIESLGENYGDYVEAVLLPKGLKVRERKAIFQEIRDGSADIIVGTHAVMSDKIEYKNLGFIAIDEQQKFGAEQRTHLLHSRTDGKIPDLLMQTATPIPRTTAQVLYGDVDLIELKEKPAGRIPIETAWLQEDPIEFTEQITNPVWSDIISEVERGNQAFVIAPFIQESTKIDSASVEKAFDNIKNRALKGVEVGVVHGQMKPAEQQEVMEDFKNKKYDVLVASTVVEVGIDIRDATRIVILSAERMGSASLHQIRGRVGRNDKPSKCYLVSLAHTDNAKERMAALVEHADGFAVAQKDLEIRGEGQIFSSEQSGRSDMIFANLAKHAQKIEDAKIEAIKILKSPFREKAIEDAREKFSSESRMM